MSLRKLPSIAPVNLDGVSFEPPQSVMAKWNRELQAAKADNNTIEIYDQIGDDFMGGGVTTKRISAALRSIGEKPVTVSINSPGGSMFEGIAIYNMLREHKEKVTVKVVGLAASAASIIAMAGDEVQIAKSGFMMIHNAWILAMGNRFDLMDAADQLEPFDMAMADLYAERTGIERKKIEKMMDSETWMTGEEAVNMGFATGLLPSDAIQKSDAGSPQSTLKRIDIALAKEGVSRSERRAMLKEITGKPSAADTVTPSADDSLTKALSELVAVLNSKKTGKNHVQRYSPISS